MFSLATKPSLNIPTKNSYKLINVDLGPYHTQENKVSELHSTMYLIDLINNLH